MRPTGAALAADIEGVDLAQPLPPAMVEAIRQAWADHLVLRFRGQSLDDEQLMRFSALFGELDLAPVIAAARVKIAGEDRYVEFSRGGSSLRIGNLQHHRQRRRDRRARRLRSDLAHRYVVQPGAADGQRALRARSPGLGRRHRVCQYVSRLRRPCPKTCGSGSRAGYVDTIRAATARENCAAAIPRSAIRARLPAPIIRSSAPIRSPAARRCSSAAAATLTSRASISLTATLCSTHCGNTRPSPNSPGISNGASVTLSCGTIAASCIAATNSTRMRAG